MRSSALFLSLFALIPLSASASETPAEMATRLFMSVCVPSQGSLTSVAYAAEKLHLTQLSKEKAVALSLTDAWATVDEDGQFVMGMADSTCYVLVRNVDTSELQALMQSWLPPPSSPLTYKIVEETSPKGVLTKTYAIYLKDQPFASWVVMTTDNPGIKHHGILSAKPAPGLNK